MNARGRDGCGARFCAGAVLLVWMIGVACAADKDRLSLAPKLVCDESDYEFGEVDNTKDVTHEFTIRNEGNAPLVFGKVQPDCGCTLARVMDDVLQPGDETTLKATLSLKGRQGKQRKRIIVESDDPRQPRASFYLIGEAIADLTITPDRIYWGSVRTNATAEKTADIKFRDTGAYIVESVATTHPSFTVEYESVNPGHELRLHIRPNPPLKLGNFEFDVKMKTDHPRWPVVTLPVQGRAVGDIYTTPEDLVLDAGSTQAVSRLLLVMSSLGKPFKITELKVPDPAILFKVSSMSASGYRVSFKNIPAGADLDGKNIVITTDMESMPVITVPIRRVKLEVPAAGTGPNHDAQPPHARDDDGMRPVRHEP